MGKQAPTAKADAQGDPAASALSRVADLGLNPRQQAFVVEYLKDRNAVAAYKRAGYAAKPASAEANASRLMAHAKVSEAIKRLEEQRLTAAITATGITLERTLLEIAKGAFFDVRKLFHPDGRPREIPDLDDETAAVIAGLDVLEEYRGTGEEREFVGYVKKYKLADRKGYLDMLMKHLGGYAKDNAATVTVKDEAPISANEIARRIAFALHKGLMAQKDAP